LSGQSQSASEQSRKKNKDMKLIKVRTDSGRTFNLPLTNSQTVKKLKTLIYEQEDVPVEQQTLTFNNIVLDDDKKTLTSYGIKNGDEIALHTPMRGGGNLSFQAPDVTKETEVKFGKSSYKYWNVSPGMNYGGKCMNKDCNVFKQKVMIHRGFGDQISPSRDEHMDELIKCPSCCQKVELNAFYFYKCNVTIFYKKKDQTQLETIEKSVNQIPGS